MYLSLESKYLTKGKSGKPSATKIVHKNVQAES